MWLESRKNGAALRRKTKCRNRSMYRLWTCGRICAHGAPVITDHKAKIDHDKCVGCGRCLAVCPKDAISADYADSVAMLNYKMAEYSLAVCQNRPCFHVSLICDVSPNCDCHPENDIPILPNIGMLASFDPVALDQACADLCNQATPVESRCSWKEYCACT